MKLTCDTSVLVAALLPWHDAHDTARAAVEGVAAVPRHVLVEAYSVLTRLPRGHRVAPRVAAEAIQRLPWAALEVDGDLRSLLIGPAAAVGVSGGAAYDALIGLVARQHGLALLTRDRRAQRTYEAFGIEYRTL